MANYHSNHVSGLCCLPAGTTLYQPLPLQTVRVDATLYDLCAEVKIQQTYVNNLHPSHIECIYIFPLDEDSAVFSFEAELDGVIVKGRICEKSKARAEYDVALFSNRSAMLLEQSSDNIFQCQVGNLKYGSVCTITLTYLTLLEQEGRHNRLTLPMIIAPKYTPSDPGPTPPFPWTEIALRNTVHVSGYLCYHCLCSPIIGIRHHCDECAYDFCHYCYTHHDMGHPMHTYTEQSPALSDQEPPGTSTHTPIHSKMRDLIIQLNITMPSPIVSIQCPSHPSETKITQLNDPSNHATVFFHSVSTCSLSKDFILLLEQQRCFEPRVLCELDVVNHTAAICLAFIPPPVDLLSASQIHCELVFLIDCSGSMSGSSIACVRECMQLLLRSLPVNCYFNIITFGSSWSSLFPSSQPYDDTSLSAASHHISGLGAVLGGTEIYPPLLQVLTSNALPTHPRQVFLLTDGQVENVQQLVQLTAQHAASTRLFTFGIGDSVDRLLCKKLARAGRGKCEFVTAEDGGGSAMREKVVRQVARSMQPVLTDVMIDWRQLKNPMCEGNHERQDNSMSTQMCILDSLIPNTGFLQCPSVAPAIFMSSRYMLHALNVSLPDYVWEQAKGGHKVDLDCEISITARSNQRLEKDRMHYLAVLTGEQITLAGVIHTTAAKERIRELEDKLVPACSGEEAKKLEDEILHLATKYTLTSSKTSFVVVYNAGTEQEVAAGLALPSETCEYEYNTALWPQSRDGGRQAFSQKACRRVYETAARKASWSLPKFGNFVSSAPVTCADTDDWLARYAERSMQPASAYAEPCNQLLMHMQPASVYAESSLQPGASAYAESLNVRSVRQQSLASSAFSSNALQKTQKKQKPTAFEELILLQSANGSWQMTPALVDVATTLARTDSIVTALTMQALQTVSKKHAVDEVAVAVILALQLLENHFKHRQAEWEMLASKALFFLSEHCKVGANVQEEIKDSIAKLIVLCI